MTFINTPSGAAELICRNRAPQICRPCADRHSREGASGAVPKHWRKAWRVTCPACGAPLSDTNERPATGETLRDTSPFARLWTEALAGEATHAALASQLMQLREDVAELRAIVVLRPLTEAEIDDQASIPADALSSLGDVPLDLEKVSEEALNAWVSGYIDGAARYDESSEAAEASENSGASSPSRRQI